ncbi:MAG: hypothetical protein E7185_02920 [Erysipelotrichaceae bacterium]|nr:hypothetical protein [Erysipelotrichaceae bacterium]
MFTCPNCNGSLKFNIPTQKLKCEHCGSSFDPAGYDQNNNAEQDDFFGATVYTCKNCGAELISPDDSIVSFCSYCGSEQILEGKIARQKRPQKIIPFRISKEKTAEAFARHTDKVRFVPKEYRDPKFLEKFRGIYIPYWTYDVRFRDSVELPGTKSYRRGSYVIEEDYNVKAGLEGLYGGIPYDASSAFDDSLADELAPFHEKKMRDFAPGYLAGFYADQADVTSESYEPAVLERAGNQAIEKMRKKFENEKHIDLKFPLEQEKQNELLGTEIIDRQASLFPVWFLTWRRNDRVAYAVVNGETGKIAADIPVDVPKYLLAVILTAALLFVGLNFFVTMTAPTVLMASSALAVVAAGLFAHQTGQLHDREMHIFDRGYFLSDRDTEITAEKAEEIRERRENGLNLSSKIIEWIITALVVMIAIPISTGMIFLVFAESPIRRATLGSIVLMAPAAYFFIRSLVYLRHIHEKSVGLQAFAAFAASAAAVVILILRPVEDWWYYLGSVFCLFAVLYTCIGLINKYNLYATRDIPAFHQRKGGDDSEKE